MQNNAAVLALSGNDGNPLSLVITNSPSKENTAKILTLLKNSNDLLHYDTLNVRHGSEIVREFTNLKENVLVSVYTKSGEMINIEIYDFKQGQKAVIYPDKKDRLGLEVSDIHKDYVFANGLPPKGYITHHTSTSAKTQAHKIRCYNPHMKLIKDS